MPLFSDSERATAAAIGSLIYENPFLPGRIAAEQNVLGEAFIPEKSVWSLKTRGESNPNLSAIASHAESLAARGRERLLTSPPRSGEKGESLALYDDLVTCVLYDRYSERLAALAARESDDRVPFYDHFVTDARQFLDPAGLLPAPH